MIEPTVSQPFAVVGRDLHENSRFGIGLSAKPLMISWLVIGLESEADTKRKLSVYERAKECVIEKLRSRSLVYITVREFERDEFRGRAYLSIVSSFSLNSYGAAAMSVQSCLFCRT